MDHSILSQSGHVSKRTRDAGIERTRRELFGDGLPMPSCPQPTEKERLLRQATELRELAMLGMMKSKLIKQARKLEEKAATL